MLPRDIAYIYLEPDRVAFRRNVLQLYVPKSDVRELRHLKNKPWHHHIPSYVLSVLRRCITTGRSGVQPSEY